VELLTDIVLSIHPKYAEAIIDGRKTIEIRKTTPSHLKIHDKIYLYATAPVKTVIGYCEYYRETGVAGAPLTWHLKESCLTEQEFTAYSKYGSVRVWELCNPVKYRFPKPLSSFGIKTPPQSFVYVEKCAFCDGIRPSSKMSDKTMTGVKMRVCDACCREISYKKEAPT